ncbi:MAG: hypothetical protein PHC52_14815 [Syntrophales bacterium]|nr:hypothetical protein [Syntrophales bacterium]
MSAKQPGKMRPHALSGEIVGNPTRSTTCPICGQRRPKNRKWSTYCSDKCRKAAWRIRKENETPADVRATLARIESKLDQIISGGTT